MKAGVHWEMFEKVVCLGEVGMAVSSSQRSRNPLSLLQNADRVWQEGRQPALDNRFAVSVKNAGRVVRR